MKKKKWLLFLMGLLLTACVNLFALDPQKEVTQYIHKTWGTDDGLPNNHITALLQTSEGYLWIGTGDGLARFDGVKFDVFNSDNTADIPDNRVTVFLETLDKTLWIGTRGGLVILRNGEFHTVTKKNGLLHAVVNALHEDAQGNVWVGYRGKGLSMFKKGDLSSLAHPPEFSQVPVVNAFYTDKPGDFWLATVEGLFRLSKGILENVQLKTNAGMLVRSIIGLTEDADGNIWAATHKHGLIYYHRKDRKSYNYSREAGLRSDMINAVFIDRHGILWAGAEGGGLHRFTKDILTFFSKEEGLSNDSVNTIHEDREGNLWVGTYSGLNLLIDGKFTTYTEKEGLPDNVTWTVYEDRQKNLWITTNGGLCCLRNNRFFAYRMKDGLSSNFVSATWEDRKGNLWIGTYDKGLNRLTNGVFTQVDKDQGFSALSIRAIFEDSKGNLWVGTYGSGVFKKTAGSSRFIRLTRENGLSSDYVFVIYEDSKGALWLGTDGGGLNLLDNKTGGISIYNKENGLSSNVIFSIAEDKERQGILWIGTETNGLNFFKVDDRTIVPVTVKNGLQDSAVYHMIEDDNGFFWMSGQKGISRVQKKGLYDFVEGRKPGVTASLFGKADGMKEDECNGGFQPAGWRSADGRIWFPSTNGLVSINPDDIKINLVPPLVRIEKVIVDGKHQASPLSPPSSTLVLEPGMRKMEIHYTALSLREPRRIKFKYQLEGFETEWVRSGDRKDRIATYTTIPPGQYTFRVTACNNDGIWNKHGTSLKISIPYPFWQSWWFILLAVVAFSVFSYFAISTLRHMVKMKAFWKMKNYIGRYRIVKQIGSGGMANVFKVIAGKGSKKAFLALKLLKEEFVFDETLRSRFLKEGELVDNLVHPHIVKVFERGEHQKNLFIAMELLEGKTLDRVINQRGPLSPAEGLDIMLQILDALVEIHRAGIIHRDLKPANIMLITKGDQENFVKILDFGLAKTQSVSRVTESGMVVGTLNYLSPEQLLHSKYSAASDIYALGVIFYEMLTGQRPYKGETPLEIMQAIFKSSLKEPKALNRDIPGKLNELLLTMMEKKPKNRPSAEVLQVTLRKLKNR